MTSIDFAIHFTQGYITNHLFNSSAGGVGVDADVIVFVLAKQDVDCPSQEDVDAGGGGTIAFASNCDVDEFGRPVSIYINFCPAMLDPADFDEQLSTAVHEIFHGLGFAGWQYDGFRDEAGNVRG